MRELKPINIFLAKIFASYFIWTIIDNFLSYKVNLIARLWTGIYHLLLTVIRDVSVFIIDILGYDVVYSYRSVCIVGSYGVTIGNHCLGFGLMFAFASLIAAYPGPTKIKLWFIPMGLTLILFVNIIRTVLLTILNYKNEVLSSIDQHELFNYIVYVLIFFLWIMWTKLIDNYSDKPTKPI